MSHLQKSMHRTIYLHAGVAKTGSSALQIFLMNHRQALAELGFFLPKTGTISRAHNHRNLVQAFNPQYGMPRLLAELGRELAAEGQPERVLLTAENFAPAFAEPGFVDSLTARCAALGYRIHVIAYLRPQPAAINSRYCQTIKTWAHNQSMAEFAAAEFVSVRQDYSLLFANVLARKDIQVTLRPYSRNTLRDGLAANFMAALGVGGEEAARLGRAESTNRSPGPKTMAAWRELRARATAELPGVRRHALAALTIPLIKITDELGWNDKAFYDINAELHHNIARHLAASNDALAQRVWNARWDEVFGLEEAQIKPLNVYDPGSASREDREAFADFIEQATAAMHFFVGNAPDNDETGDDD